MAGRNVKEGSILSWALGLKWWQEESGKQHTHKKAIERVTALSEPPSDKGDKGDSPNSAALYGFGGFISIAGQSYFTCVYLFTERVGLAGSHLILRTTR